MKRALLHIGTPKTGTTSFQEWLWANRVELEGTHGVRVYEGLFGPNHYEFGLLCRRASRNGFGELEFPDHCLPEWRSKATAHIRGQVEAASSDGCNLVISSEVISFLRHDDELAKLADLLEGLEISPFAMVREPASFLKSWRRQIGPGGWSANRSSAGYTEPDSWLVDYAAMEEAFTRAFGAVSISRYEEALEADGSVIPALATTMELPLLNPRSAQTWLNSSSEKPGLPAGPQAGASMEEVARLHRRLCALSRENCGLRSQLLLEEEEADRVRDQAQRHEREVEALELSLAQARHELEATVRELDRMSSVVASMDRSVSWQVTKPARKAKAILGIGA